MKFYSEKTGKLYDTSKELKEAEKALEVEEQEKEAQKAQRAERAKENGGSVRGINAKGQGSMPRKKIDKLTAFVKDYGAYHQTIRQGEPIGVESMINLLSDLFEISF